MCIRDRYNVCERQLFEQANICDIINIGGMLILIG